MDSMDDGGAFFDPNVPGGNDDALTALLFSDSGIETKVPRTLRWRDLDERTASAAWTELHRWVRWFIATYRLTTSVVPDCWWRHSEIVAELYALQHAELASYSADDAGFGPLGFHERLTLAVERLRIHTRAAGCVGLQAHKEPVVRILPEGDPDFAAWITEPHQIRIDN